MDDDASRSLSLAEFSKALGEAALEWSEAQRALLFGHFDADQSGAISFDEFLNAVRGVLNERRQQMVLLAYELLDAGASVRCVCAN
jgi:Ca2+-binding EF-hand superfamily protein